MCTGASGKFRASSPRRPASASGGGVRQFDMAYTVGGPASETPVRAARPRASPGETPDRPRRSVRPASRGVSSSRGLRIFDPDLAEVGEPREMLGRRKSRTAVHRPPAHAVAEDEAASYRPSRRQAAGTAVQVADRAIAALSSFTFQPEPHAIQARRRFGDRHRFQRDHRHSRAVCRRSQPHHAHPSDWRSPARRAAARS